MPSSSSNGENGNNHDSTIMTDSNVLRLIRRYDPIGSSTLGIKSRRPNDDNQEVSHTITNKPVSSLLSNASSFPHSYLSQKTSTLPCDDNNLIKQSSSSNITNSIRPILKYTSSTARSELNIQPNKTEPLTIEIEPRIPLSLSTRTKENTITYQPLITTGIKRVCPVISKSECDLHLKRDLHTSTIPLQSSTFPVQFSTLKKTINQQLDKEYSLKLVSRSKSSSEVNNKNRNYNEYDDNVHKHHENSSLITTGSCVEKLKNLFDTKVSFDLLNSPMIDKQSSVDSIKLNMNRNINETNVYKPDLLLSTTSTIPKIPDLNVIESQTQIPSNHDSIQTRTATIHNDIPTSSLSKRSMLKSQKTINQYVDIILLDDEKDLKRRKKKKHIS